MMPIHANHTYLPLVVKVSRSFPMSHHILVQHRGNLSILRILNAASFVLRVNEGSDKVFMSRLHVRSSSYPSAAGKSENPIKSNVMLLNIIL